MCAFQGPTVIDGSGVEKVAVTQTARVFLDIIPSEADKLQGRLNTYRTWNSKKDPKQLAEAGFVHTGIGDKVECLSCGIRLYNWQDDEEPLQAHKKYAPDCEFMATYFPQIKAPPKPKKVTNVRYPHYSEYDARLKSFESWPLKCVVQSPEIMAKSGFFYIGSADRARCFFCGVTLRDWDTDDYPPCAHKQWSESCPFVATLDVNGLKAEIEDLERQEQMKEVLRNSHFISCSSSLRSTSNNYTDLVVDGVVEPNVSSQVHAQASEPSNDSSSFTPAIQAVLQMGYTTDIIKKALEIKTRNGDANPNARSIMETIFDMEG